MDQKILRALAQKYIWWSSSDKSVIDLKYLCAQVLNMGTWEDANQLISEVGIEYVKDVLNTVSPGIISKKSWYFWHVRLKIKPSRSFPEGRKIA